MSWVFLCLDKTIFYLLRKLLTIYTAFCEGGAASHRIQGSTPGITIHGYYYFTTDLFHVQFVCNIACFLSDIVAYILCATPSLSFTNIYWCADSHMCEGLSRDVIIPIKAIVLYRAFVSIIGLICRVLPWVLRTLLYITTQIQMEALISYFTCKTRFCYAIIQKIYRWSFLLNNYC